MPGLLNQKKHKNNSRNHQDFQEENTGSVQS